jgi:gamma-carbonic anhydrase
MKMLIHDHHPQCDDRVFIAPSADVIGDVRLATDASVFYQCVLRGDINYISIGKRSNIQDLSCMHVADAYPCIVGDECVIGHKTMLHGCSIGSHVLIGMSATLLNGVHVGNHCLIGAGALLVEGMQVPDRSVVMGSPAKVVRPIKDAEQVMIQKMVEKYIAVKNAHLKEFGTQ